MKSLKAANVTQAQYFFQPVTSTQMDDFVDHPASNDDALFAWQG